MPGRNVPLVREALVTYGRTGQFSEQDYAALRAVLASGVRRGVLADMFDGWVHAFFERHLLDDARRDELIALSDEALGPALRHRFRQVIADEQDDRQAYRALKAHVRAVLDEASLAPPAEAVFPAAIREGERFVFAEVRRAVLALWAEERRRPEVGAATTVLLERYLDERVEVSESQDPPEVLRRRLDGRRLAEGILALLSDDERDLLRCVLVGESNVDRWAERKGLSRASAYRMLSRLKALCQVELEERSPATALAALQAITEGS